MLRREIRDGTIENLYWYSWRGLSISKYFKMRQKIEMNILKYLRKTHISLLALFKVIKGGHTHPTNSYFLSEIQFLR